MKAEVTAQLVTDVSLMAIWRRDSNETASGKFGAVQIVQRRRTKR
jgi:hypothetical protein